MDHILDNMIWNAITTGNNDIAIVSGDVGCYLPDIAPFAGMKVFNDAILKNCMNLFLPIGVWLFLRYIKWIMTKATGNFCSLWT